VELGVDAGGADFAVHPHGVGQEQVAGAPLCAEGGHFDGAVADPVEKSKVHDHAMPGERGRSMGTGMCGPGPG
jgi:hypothetical protein